jgi:Right handed beta helix region
MIRYTATGILCLLFAATAPAAQSVQATFTVSPGGNDANPGTSAQPFLTLERARQAVRALSGAMTGDIVVTVRGGTYTLPSTLTFDAADSGTNGFRVIYRAAAGEKPVLSGGQRITGWSAAGGGVYRASIGSLRFRQLYVDGRRAVRARQPNDGSYYQHRGYDEANRRIIVAASEISNWQRLNRVELVILTGNVAQRNLRVSSFSVSGTSASVTPMQPERDRAWAWPYPPRFSGQYYYYENAFEFLDAPGEFYLNPSTEEVFYRPRAGEDLAAAVVIAPRLENVLRIQGTLAAPVHHLRFEGLTFEHSTWLNPDAEGFVGDQAFIEFTQSLPNDQMAAYPGHRIPAAVHVEAANNVRFERNVFRRTGAGAVIFRTGVSDAQFVGNVIEETGGYGIGVDQNLEGNPADLRKVCRRVQIRNNYIHGIGRDNLGNAAVVCGYTDGAVIEHNEIHDASYVGISVGWGWTDRDNVSGNNLVRYNEIYSTDTVYGDAGGIYTLSRQRGTLVAENYVHDIVYFPWTAYGFSSAGVFLDEGSNFITVRDNVLLNVPERIKLNAVGSGNVFANNDGSSAPIIANAGLEPAYHDIKPPPPPPPYQASNQAEKFDAPRARSFPARTSPSKAARL